MDRRSFVFKISPYNAKALLPQTGAALEKRTEMLSRKKHPGLWKITDKLRSAPTGKPQNSLGNKLMSIACLGMGIFLFVPGLLEPKKLLLPLLVGAMAILVGIAGILKSFEAGKGSFKRSAKLLLKEKAFILEGSFEARFLETEMILSYAGSETEHVPYKDFECAVETADLFLFVHGAKATLLQKKDLTGKTAEEFENFIKEKTQLYFAN